MKTAGPDGALLAGEADGLEALAASGTVRVPRVLAVGGDRVRSWLVLEWLDLKSADAECEAMLGERLAALHACTGERFGWRRDNTLGGTPQVNTPDSDWPRFFAVHRLGFQLERARLTGCAASLYEAGMRLCERVNEFFAGYFPVPSLVHGDLWGGNHAATRDGEPVIFDPAVYHADREVDIAMTHLFGGFGAEFHRAYEATWPMDEGARVRRDLYNLYHVLNHFNLFGGEYEARAARMVATLLAQVR